MVALNLFRFCFVVMVSVVRFFFSLSPLVFEVQLICSLCSLFTFTVPCQQHLCNQTFIHRLLLNF